MRLTSRQASASLFPLGAAMFVLSSLAVVWWMSVGDPARYLSPDVPSGQLFYVVSKLCGLLAAGILCLQIVIAT